MITRMCPVPLCGQTIIEQPDAVRAVLREIVEHCGAMESDDPNVPYVLVRMPRAVWQRLDAARRG
jgi:hypothetical protein